MVSTSFVMFVLAVAVAAFIGVFLFWRKEGVPKEWLPRALPRMTSSALIIKPGASDLTVGDRVMAYANVRVEHGMASWPVVVTRRETIRITEDGILIGGFPASDDDMAEINSGLRSDLRQGKAIDGFDFDDELEVLFFEPATAKKMALKAATSAA